MPILKPQDLNGAWSNWSIMSRDKGIDGVDAQDGELTTAELRSTLTNLRKQHDKYVAAGYSTSYIDAQIDVGDELLADMKAVDASAVQYLPDAVMNLPVRFRRRACEILQWDDSTDSGKITQSVIDKARDRYASVGGVGSHHLNSTKALAEIDKIALALDLD